MRLVNKAGYVSVIWGEDGKNMGGEQDNGMGETRREDWIYGELGLV